MSLLNNKKQMIRIQKLGVAVAVFCLGGFMLVGCGSGKTEKTQLSIDKDGVITSVIYEEFSEDYYDLDELSDMAAQEVSYYNSEYITPKISLEETTVIEKDEQPVLKMTMVFNSYSDYSHFNQFSFFYGTVQEALDKGFEVSELLVDEDGNSFKMSELSDYLDKHIVISADKTCIVTPYSILYSTNGTVLENNKTADFSNVSSDIVQLILSK